MYDPANRSVPNLAFLWPAFVAASASEMNAIVAKQFANFALGHGGPALQPQRWTTPHTVTLELETVLLRNFTTEAKNFPALLCAPFALHGAAVSDLATGHSLVAALSDAGLKRLF